MIFVLLASKLQDLSCIIDILKSTKDYISRSDRDLMVRALSFYERREDEDLFELISALRASTKSSIPQEMRNSIVQKSRD